MTLLPATSLAGVAVGGALTAAATHSMPATLLGAAGMGVVGGLFGGQLDGAKTVKHASDDEHKMPITDPVVYMPALIGGLASAGGMIYAVRSGAFGELMHDTKLGRGATVALGAVAGAATLSAAFGFCQQTS